MKTRTIGDFEHIKKSSIICDEHHIIWGVNMFKVGDIVLLSSGGPKMTVSDITDEEFILCQWFDTNMECHTKCFAAKCLIKYQAVEVPKVALW